MEINQWILMKFLFIPFFLQFMNVFLYCNFFYFYKENSSILYVTYIIDNLKIYNLKTPKNLKAIIDLIILLIIDDLVIINFQKMLKIKKTFCEKLDL